MNRAVSGFIGIGALFISANAALACLPPERPAGWYDKRIAVAADGSFENAEETFQGAYRGRAVVDIGGGKIGQRLRYDSFCGYREWLLVVDCQKAQLIVIDGRVDPDSPDDFGGGPSNTVDMLYAPEGKVRLDPNVTIDQLVQLATTEGYEFDTNRQSAFEDAKRRNRYNPYTGCSIFYPDSPGAQQ